MSAMTTHGVNIDTLRDEVVALSGLRDASNADRSKLRIEIDSLRARLEHAEAQREELLDCHPADGVSLCGACLSCWARGYNQVVRERDAARAVLGKQADQLSHLIDAEDVGQSGVSKLYAVVLAMRAAAEGQG